MSIKYRHLAVRCGLSTTPLKQAAKDLTPSSVYTVYVSAEGMHYYDAKHIAAHAMETENPFAPYINIQIDPELSKLEWYVKDEHGNAVGSEGC